VREETARRRQAWSERLAVLFWRGSTTGTRVRPPPGPEEPDDFTWLPRLDACARAQRSPLRDHYDLGISNIVQIKEAHVVRRIEQSGLCRPSVQRSAFLAHKAILVIDGNSNAWSAMFCALLSGACVVKVESPAGFRQWYYHRMRPWVHFVPVSADLSDLDDAVAWILANDEGARAIGDAGRALALAMTFQAEVEDAALRLRARAEEDVLF
jgi:hypothetical protein